ncbi:hypothetical protein [Streptomyces sp. NBC_01233]|uniref:hypothetical protein n=1 Tax=Streptomyces sp. NBC_01233 TaxID=2903787 RepID=UPI002E0F1CEB|nr:hypothetical protein OG332_11440 [Streptomyces sp. NBC_01233]
MSAGLRTRLLRLERPRAEAAALGAEVLALLAELERDDPAGYAALLPRLSATIPTRERTR